MSADGLAGVLVGLVVFLAAAVESAVAHRRRRASAEVFDLSGSGSVVFDLPGSAGEEVSLPATTDSSVGGGVPPAPTPTEDSVDRAPRAVGLGLGALDTADGCAKALDFVAEVLDDLRLLDRGAKQALDGLVEGVGPVGLGRRGDFLERLDELNLRVSELRHGLPLSVQTDPAGTGSVDGAPSDSALAGDALTVGAPTDTAAASPAPSSPAGDQVGGGVTLHRPRPRSTPRTRPRRALHDLTTALGYSAADVHTIEVRPARLSGTVVSTAVADEFDPGGTVHMAREFTMPAVTPDVVGRQRARALADATRGADRLASALQALSAAGETDVDLRVGLYRRDRRTIASVRDDVEQLDCTFTRAVDVAQAVIGLDGATAARIVAAGGVVTSVLGVIAGGLGTAYRPTT